MLKSKVLLSLFLLLLLNSCVTQQKCNSKFPPAVKSDSIYIEKIKEVPVYIPGDTINVGTPIKCPDQDLVNIETLRLRQQIKILNGKLVSSTIINPDTIKVKVTETHTEIKEVKVPEPVKYIPKIYKDAMGICIFIFAAAFIFIGWKAYTFFKK